MSILYTDFLKQLTGCPFCEGKNHILKENEHAYLTYSLAPYHKHHLLVLPKRHIESLSELTLKEEEAIETLQQTALQLLKKLGYKSVTLLVREGDLSETKTIAHVHYHAIPKIQIGDLDHYGEQRVVMSPEEIDATIKDISAFL